MPPVGRGDWEVEGQNKNPEQRPSYALHINFSACSRTTPRTSIDFNAVGMTCLENDTQGHLLWGLGMWNCPFQIHLPIIMNVLTY